jgi:hypothetical protein
MFSRRSMITLSDLLTRTQTHGSSLALTASPCRLAPSTAHGTARGSQRDGRIYGSMTFATLGLRGLPPPGQVQPN